MSLQIGDPIPDFSLVDQEGTCRTSEECKGKALVLFFYPMDNTPGCKAEVCGFRDTYELFSLLGAEVWGVNNADEASHRKFAEQNQLPFSLLCDESNALRNQFGVPKTLALLDGRVTYVIDSNGIIRYIFNDFLNATQHVTEALRIVEEIR